MHTDGSKRRTDKKKSAERKWKCEIIFFLRISAPESFFQCVVHGQRLVLIHLLLDFSCGHCRLLLAAQLHHTHTLWCARAPRKDERR